MRLWVVIALLVFGLAGPTLAEPTVTAVPSQSVSISVKDGPGGKLDWVGLFPVGASSTGYLQWMRLNGLQSTPTVGKTQAVLTFKIPDTGCPCKVRFYTSDGAGRYTQLGKSCPITLTGSS